jgi:DNA-binding CsgD family transcriptional regulator/DNA polymerase III delta prime subunit
VVQFGRRKLYGRHQEFERFRFLADDACRGRGGTLLISGPVGSGKTALAQALIEDLSDEQALVLTATASRTERDTPAGVAEQLLRNAVLPEDCRSVVTELFGASPAGTFARPSTAELIQRVPTAILDLAQDRLVVILVDDLQYVDSESLQLLLYVQRRMHNRHLLVVLTELTPAPLSLSVFHAELFRQPRCCWIRLRMLSAASATAMFTEGVGAPVDAELVKAALHVSGCNPLLLAALIEDHHLVAAVRLADSPELATTEFFRNAITSCLLRMDARIRETAKGLAVLGERAEQSMLVRLLALPAATVVQALGALTDAGMIESGRFRHRAAAASALDTMMPEQRAALHLRAARLLHEYGAQPRVVAAQLVTAGQAPEPWMVVLLRRAADEARSVDDVEFAADCLELALFACQDEAGRATVMALLARIEWRNNPSAARRFIRPLRVALRRGRLCDSDAGMLVRFLIWDGHIRQAEETLAWWEENVTEPTVELRFTRAWLRYCCPSVLVKPVETAIGGPAGPSAPAGGEPLVDMCAPTPAAVAIDAFAVMLSQGPSRDSVDSAERVLQSQRVDDLNIEALCAALEVLLCAGELDSAATWCDRLLAQAGQRRVGAWQAMLGSIRSEIALRQIDLEAAVAYARSAVGQMSLQDWGVCVGAPVSSLVKALTMLGHYDEASRELNSQVSGELFATRYGLQYLYARGLHSMAIGHPHAALADFENCGRLMIGWGIDLPALVPWRGAAAEALLRLGRQDKARELIEQQLKCPGVDDTRIRGVSLRILAACDDPVESVPLLQESADLLKAEEDRLERAVTLADLSNRMYALGDLGHARALAEHAMDMVRASQVEPALWQQSVAGGRLAALEEGDVVSVLSPAEQPVARLAANGYTNREISRKLFITMSTVEQHLTRVYRKLNVRSRADLAAHLHAKVS